MGNEKNTAANTPEMVTISRAEYDSQQAQLAELAELKLQNQWLLEQLGLAKKRQFGASSERLQEGLMDQLSLMANEAEAYAYGTKNATAEQVAVKAHARKRQSGNVLDIVPEGTPTEVVEHRLSEEERTCDTCGAVMEEIGKEVRRSLKMEPARFWIREDVYYTYACKQCEAETGEGNLRKTPKQPTLCPGSFASPEAVAYIMTQKFVMYSPLYRLEQEFQRQGLKLSRQTMANWILQASDTWLRPVYDALHRRLCQETVLHGDETTLQVLKEPGRTSTSKSYMWVYRTSGCAEQPIVLYEYQPGRGAKHPKAFLTGFRGYLHTDGYAGYHNLSDEITVVGCWAHARRKFDEAVKSLPKGKAKGGSATQGLAYCNKLFELEDTFSGLSPEERYVQRLEQAKPVLDALLAWANTRTAAPKSALGKALTYLKEQWPYRPARAKNSEYHPPNSSPTTGKAANRTSGPYKPRCLHRGRGESIYSKMPPWMRY